MLFGPLMIHTLPVLKREVFHLLRDSEGKDKGELGPTKWPTSDMIDVWV